VHTAIDFGPLNAALPNTIVYLPSGRPPDRPTTGTYRSGGTPRAHISVTLKKMLNAPTWCETYAPGGRSRSVSTCCTPTCCEEARVTLTREPVLPRNERRASFATLLSGKEF
jgi:hypothetical protein